MNKLLTIDEVAVILRKSPRTVRRLKGLEFSRIGSSRRYDERDVEAYRKGKLECQSSCAKDRRSTIASSKSKDIGFLEALRKIGRAHV